MIALRLLCIALICFTISACNYTSVDAGEEAVLIYKPWFFGHGGVDKDPVGTGATWTAWSTSVERYNIKPEKKKETFVDLTASDNVAIDFDVYLTLQIQKGKTPLLHELSGRKWYDNKVKDTFRAYVRNEARTKSSIDLRTNEHVINQTQEKIKQLMVLYIEEISLPVNVVKVNIGKVVPPDEVLAEAARTAAQKQREFNMNTNQFLRNKELDIMSKAVESGSVSLIINASDAQPMLKLGK